MLKALTQLTSLIEGKEGHLLVAPETPLAIIKEMLMEFLVHVGNVEAQQKAQLAAQAIQVQQENLPVQDVNVPVAEPAQVEQSAEPQAN